MANVNASFWDKCWHWHRDFRLTLPAIMRLEELVGPRLEKQYTQPRNVIQIEKRVAVGI